MCSRRLHRWGRHNRIQAATHQCQRRLCHQMWLQRTQDRWYFSSSQLSPNINSSILLDACVDLPKYASCGYLRFKRSTFRDTTYNLLTDTQKKEFHSRAIRYIEKETKRCRFCGNGFFERILGKRTEKVRWRVCCGESSSTATSQP